LANNYSNLFQWPFPGGASIGPASSRSFLPTAKPISPRPRNGTPASRWPRAPVARAQPHLQRPAQVLDYLDYSGLRPDRSYGSASRRPKLRPSGIFLCDCGGTNNATSAPITIYINEWMADNTHTLADPADNDFEDWIELYNQPPLIST